MKQNLKSFAKPLTDLFANSNNIPDQRQKTFSGIIRSNLIIFLFLFLLVTISYAQAIPNGFIGDDFVAKDNTKYDNFSNITSLQEFIFFPFYIAHHIDRDTTTNYRLFNLVYHLISTFCVYIVILLIANRPRIAFFTATLFAVHPILSESVLWIAAVWYTQYTCFFLISFLFYLLSNRKSKWYYLFSLVFFALALMSSTKAVSLFLIIIAYELFLGDWKKNLRKLTPFVLLGLIALFFYATQVPDRITALQAYSSAVSDQQQRFINPFFQLPTSYGFYLLLIAGIKKMTFCYTGLRLTRLEHLINVLITFGYFTALFQAFKKNKAVFFWLAFFSIAIIPVITPFRIAEVVAERYAYLGTLGILVVIAMGFDWLLENYPRRSKLIYASFFLLIAFFTSRTLQRNIDWKNERSLWLSAVDVAPYSSTVRNNVGLYLKEDKKYDESISEFMKALELDPLSWITHYNLADTYNELNQADLALTSYKTVIRINPGCLPAYQQIAQIYITQGDYVKAYEIIMIALEIYPDNEELKQSQQMLVQFFQQQS